MEDGRSSYFNLQSSILHLQSSILHPQSSILNPQSSILDLILGRIVVSPLPVQLNDSRKFILAFEIKSKSAAGVLVDAARGSGVQIPVECQGEVANPAVSSRLWRNILLAARVPWDLGLTLVPGDAARRCAGIDDRLDLSDRPVVTSASRPSVRRAMFIAAKRSLSRPPSGGPCQPRMCELRPSNNGVLTWDESASQPRQHGPPDGGRDRLATGL
jgi:hypothetical protein